MRKRNTLYEYFESIGNLGEVVLALYPLKKGALEKWVLKSFVYSQSGLSARIPDADLLIGLSTLLCLVKVKKEKNKTLISLTDAGKRLLTFKQLERDRFTKQQGRYLLSAAIKKIDIYRDLISVINIFSTGTNKDLHIDPHDTRIGYLENLILRLFQQLGIAKYCDGNIIIPKNEIGWLLSTVSPVLHMDIDDLLDSLEARRQYGQLAEEYVLNKEKERLTGSKREDLAQLVRKISNQNIAAGYDILSFDGIDSDVSPDRFIEVKGTTGNQISFYLSKNELDTAQKLRDKYWVYCVLNVKTIKSKKLIMMRDPYKTVFQNKKYIVEPVLWRVCPLR
jgi:hypothetical protein